MDKDSLFVEDHFKSKEKFELQWNDKWKWFSTIPVPSELEIQKYYQSSAYISHQKNTKTLKDIIYNRVRNYMFSIKLIWIKKELNDDKNLLDIGSGVGAFLSYARKKGFNVKGIEPNQKARQIALDSNLSVYESLENLLDECFDVITLWHVLEHVHQPDKFLKQIVDKLNKKGVLFIAVPNFKSYDAKYYKEYWAAFDVPRHLYHFSKESIQLLARHHGLTVTKTYPLKFDSYYVSMLSEKYKKGKNSFDWIYRGWKSNQEAKKNGEWSSLVYVLKKENKSK